MKVSHKTMKSGNINFFVPKRKENNEKKRSLPPENVYVRSAKDGDVFVCVIFPSR